MTERRDRDAKRSAILEAVWRIVATRGLNSVTFRTVAAEADVSPGRVQYYFASKGDLIRGSVTHMIEVAHGAHLDATREDSPVEELWMLLTHAIPHASSSPAGTSVFYSFVAASVTDPGIAAILADAKRGAEHRAAELLRTIRPGSAHSEQAARQLLALSDGVTLGVLIGSLSPDQAHATITEALADLSIRRQK